MAKACGLFRMPPEATPQLYVTCPATIGTPHSEQRGAILLADAMPFLRDRELLTLRWSPADSPRRDAMAPPRVQWDPKLSEETTRTTPTMLRTAWRGPQARAAHAARVLERERAAHVDEWAESLRRPLARAPAENAAKSAPRAEPPFDALREPLSPPPSSPTISPADDAPQAPRDVPLSPTPHRDAVPPLFWDKPSAPPVEVEAADAAMHADALERASDTCLGRAEDTAAGEEHAAEGVAERIAEDAGVAAPDAAEDAGAAASDAAEDAGAAAPDAAEDADSAEAAPAAVATDADPAEGSAAAAADTTAAAQHAPTDGAPDAWDVSEAAAYDIMLQVLVAVREHPSFRSLPERGVKRGRLNDLGLLQGTVVRRGFSADRPLYQFDEALRAFFDALAGQGGDAAAHEAAVLRDFGRMLIGELRAKSTPVEPAPVKTLPVKVPEAAELRRGRGRPRGSRSRPKELRDKPGAGQRPAKVHAKDRAGDVRMPKTLGEPVATLRVDDVDTREGAAAPSKRGGEATAAPAKRTRRSSRVK